LPDEKELLTFLLQTPEQGLEIIMNRYMAFVYTIVYGKLSDVCKKQDMEECVSDIFFEVYRTRSLIDLEKGSLKAYLAVVAKRRAIDVFRKHKGNAEDVSLDAFGHDWLASKDSVTAGENSDILVDEIKALGEPDSQILIRKYYFGQSAKAIARVLGLKENTVNKRASRALAKLKVALGGAL
jgi:RNA polymerase sigma-70 factor (ECF subfamily)